jgi:DNA-binding NarL/FixJ family response regulator
MKGTRIRVVVADDEPDVVLLLRVQLEMLEDFEVVGAAATGLAAVDVIRDARPDAVIMDLLMPGMNGFEAIGVIQEEFPDVAIVAYTGVAGDYVRTEMQRLGVALVLKSGSPDGLARALRQAVTRRQPS